jgi:hypothetical protein
MSKSRHVKRLHERVASSWRSMTLTRKLTYAAAVASSAMVMAGAYASSVNFGNEIVEKHLGRPPFASQTTEFVIAGWQSDRISNDLRDIKGRIERLEIKRKVPGMQFNVQDQRELDYWYGEYRRNEQTLKEIDSTRRPVWQQTK